MEENEISGQVVDAAMKVHSALGPGLLESAYQAYLKYELSKRDLRVEAEAPLPLKYDELIIEIGYRVDLLVEERVIVELKSVDKILPIHEAQLLSYLRLEQSESWTVDKLQRAAPERRRQTHGKQSLTNLPFRHLLHSLLSSSPRSSAACYVAFCQGGCGVRRSLGVDVVQPAIRSSTRQAEII